MGKIFKSYLEWANFNKIVNMPPRYRKLLLIDFAVALLYTVASIKLIFSQEVSIIVYELNILILLRALLSNAVNASKVTHSKFGEGVNKKHEGNSHYHLKVAMLGMCVLLGAFLFVLLLKEPSDMYIRAFSSLFILIVFINDCEDMVVYAYDAEINMKERT